MIEVRSYKERLLKQHMPYLATERKAQKADIPNSTPFYRFTEKIHGTSTYFLGASPLINMYLVGSSLVVLKDIHQETFDYFIYWKEF